MGSVIKCFVIHPNSKIEKLMPTVAVLMVQAAVDIELSYRNETVDVSIGSIVELYKTVFRHLTLKN